MAVVQPWCDGQLKWAWRDDGDESDGPGAPLALGPRAPTTEIATLSKNRVLCTNALNASIAAGRPVLVKGAVDASVVAAVVAAVAAERGRPLAPFAGENIASQERNGVGAETAARDLLAGESPGGQLRVSAPDVAVAAAARLLAGSGRDLHLGDSLTFCNSAGMRTPMHLDARDGLLLHCLGAKRALLAPPDAADAVAHLRFAAGPQDDAVLRNCPRGLALVSARLDVGDALFLPRRWFHDVESETATVSVSVRLQMPRGLEYEEALEGF